MVPIFEFAPFQPQCSGIVFNSDRVKVRDLRMRGLNTADLTFDFIAILEVTGGHAFFKPPEGILNANGETAPDRQFFIFSRRRAAQDVSFITVGRAHAFDFDIRSNLLPTIFEQFLLKLLQLRSRRADQILSTSTPNRFQIFFTDDAAIELMLQRENEGVALTLDGQIGYTMKAKDRVVIRKSRTTFNLVQPPNRNYFDVLRNKLKWGR